MRVWSRLCPLLAMKLQAVIKLSLSFMICIRSQLGEFLNNVCGNICIKVLKRLKKKKHAYQ